VFIKNIRKVLTNTWCHIHSMVVVDWGHAKAALDALVQRCHIT